MIPKLLHNPTIPLVGLIVAIVLFPLAAWMDFTLLINRELSGQAGLLNQMLTESRQLYNETLGAGLADQDMEMAKVDLRTHRFGSMSFMGEPTSVSLFDHVDKPFGTFQVPATFTIQLARRLTARTPNAEFAFISDYPFNTRPGEELTPTQLRILHEMRDQQVPEPKVETGSPFHPSLTLYSPIVMSESCVQCHNMHEGSTKKDWKTGDVRGLQVVSLRPDKASMFSLKRYMISDFGILILFCGWLYTAQRHQRREIETTNEELQGSRMVLEKLSRQLAKYMPPQMYKALLRRKFEVHLTSERKKLTILFADIVEFTPLSERLQPEELTELLNLYFDELSRIAEKHGGTVNKFIGDAVLVFFGHPESRGSREDATACFNAAREMIASLPSLNAAIRKTTPTVEVCIRIGINTGICNVGNFGSSKRLDYTVIGAEVNVAARVIKAARPNGIVITDNTLACIDVPVGFVKLPVQEFKGVSRKVAVYRVEEPEINGHAQEELHLKAEGLELSVSPEQSDLHDLRAAQASLEAMIREKERR